ncbi:ABC transporter permease [Sphingobacterium detergens]|uniref:MacB-like protein n=1 Tax=Sphingobacterium detergens TaxID=1145106 RepID=A0A420BGK8_SPHD1|nr:FtsX-like permease family protein [Sphingobacterium detergens]RKE55816.1 MacB-like protein [Sphingobacterium detergens]
MRPRRHKLRFLSYWYGIWLVIAKNDRMFSNYLKIAIRILWHNKVYVTLNILGLGFAIACCILSYLNYNYRANFDKNQRSEQAVFRLNSIRMVDGTKQPWATIPSPVADALVKEKTGLGRTVRFSNAAVVVKIGEHTFDEHIHFTDRPLFDLFNFPLRDGNLSGFDQPNQLIISETVADKYFPKQNPVGQSVTLIAADGTPNIYTIAAVTKQIPTNSSIQFDMITAYNNGAKFGLSAADDWSRPNAVTTFIELTDREGATSAMANLNPYIALNNQHHKDQRIEGFTFQPFAELATSSDIDMPGYIYGSQLNTNPRGVLVIVPAIMSLLILLITCFNFTNISIAFASSRLKEIGIRKVIGGVRRQLVGQFLTENMILCLLSAALAILFVQLLLPTVNQLTGLDLSPDYRRDFGFWLFLLCIPAVCAILSGLYPALYITSFQPISILKGKTALGASSRFTRFLLVAQFSLSCFALVVGIVMAKNARFQQKADFGYAINEVAVVTINTPQEYTLFSTAVRQNPMIKNLAGTTEQIGESSYTQTAVAGKDQIQTQVARIGGEDYLNSMGIRLLRGRHFFSTGKDSEESIIVNETFLQRLQLKQAIGQQVTLDSVRYTIVGVVNDYKEYGLHGLVPPCVLHLAKPDEYKSLVIRADKEKLGAVNKYLQSTWNRLMPNMPYRAYLQSDVIEKEIRMTEAFRSIAFFLAVVTLLLSASGLFAQISLNIDKRNREIGVRKVLGASIVQIIQLISKEFVRILLIAFAVGSVLGYLFTSKFIFQVIYHYHSPVGLEPYVGTLAIVVFCCCLIIGARVYRAARTNPVERLRAE